MAANVVSELSELLTSHIVVHRLKVEGGCVETGAVTLKASKSHLDQKSSHHQKTFVTDFSKEDHPVEVLVAVSESSSQVIWPCFPFWEMI